MAAHPILDVLPTPERQALDAAMRRRRFTRGETIFHEGDPGSGVHLIDRGRVAIRVTTPLGDIATLALFGPGDAFGEGALLAEDGARTATVIALETTEIRTISRDRFERLRNDYPLVERFLVQILAAQVRRLSTRLLEALYVPADERVLRRVAELAELYGGDDPVVIPLTQDDIATMAGTTRPTVNRVLKKAEERSGLRVAGRGRIEVLDVARLSPEPH